MKLFGNKSGETPLPEVPNEPAEPFSGNDFWQEPPRETPQIPSVDWDTPKSKGYSIAALVLGILGVICCCTGYSALLFGALAVVYSVISRKHLGFYDGLALAGLILGIVACVLGVSELVATYFFTGSASEEFWEYFFNSFEDAMGENGGEIPDINHSF